MECSKVYKLGMVGFGGMAQFHRTQILAGMEEIELHGVFDIREERQEFGRELGLKVFDSLQDMLADEAIDLILIVTPNDTHKDIAIQALRAKKHVICEKPVTLNSEELREIIQVSEETGMFFTVHQNRRWDEDFLTIKQLYEEKKLGEVYRIESRVHGSRGIPGDWRQLPEHGGGMVLDWGVHLLDQIMWMLGEVPRKAYASVTHVTNQLVDDGFFTELEFSDGLKVVVEVGTSNFISLPRWYVLGQNGTAVLESWNDDARLVTAKGESERDVVPVITAAGLTKTMAPRRKENISEEIYPHVESDVRDFLRNVLLSIEGKEERIVKLTEVEAVMRVMEAIFESAEKGQVIDLSE